MTHPAAPPRPFVRRFNPVVMRHRRDGWTPEKQTAFIEALAESACVVDGCRRVGMSTESAYTLRRRYDAVDFRRSWDAALEYAVQRVSEGAIGRAIHGVAVPHYYKGELVGEHRRFNEALVMFILRYRDPSRYAKHWDGRSVVQHDPEEAAQSLAVHLDAVATGASDELHDYENGVIDAAAVIATDEELDDLGRTQYERGVPAAVDEAIDLIAMFNREADAEERAGLVVHDAPDPAVAARFADVLAVEAAPAAQVAAKDAAAIDAAAVAPVADRGVDPETAAMFADFSARAADAALADHRNAGDAAAGAAAPAEIPAFHSDMASTSSTSAAEAAGSAPLVARLDTMPARPAVDPPVDNAGPDSVTGICDPETGPAWHPYYPLPQPKWPPTRWP